MYLHLYDGLSLPTKVQSRPCSWGQSVIALRSPCAVLVLPPFTHNYTKKYSYGNFLQIAVWIIYLSGPAFRYVVQKRVEGRASYLVAPCNSSATFSERNIFNSDWKRSKVFERFLPDSQIPGSIFSLYPIPGSLIKKRGLAGSNSSLWRNCVI